LELVIYQKAKTHDVFIGESIETDHNPLVWHVAKDKLLDYYLDVYLIHVNYKSIEITVKERETNRTIKFRKVTERSNSIVWQLVSYPTKSTSEEEDIEVIASISSGKDINKWYDDKLSLLKEYLK
jgi:hypothetical protein